MRPGPRCAAAYTGGDDGCDFFSYEWEETEGGYYHECYLKTKVRKTPSWPRSWANFSRS
jgi:hypothetical protein